MAWQDAYDDLVEQILGDAAPDWRRDVIALSPLCMGRSVRVRQRMAVCELPLAVHGPIVYPCLTLGVLDGLGRHVCAYHWALLWICWGCGAWLPEGTSGYCSQPCTRSNHATQTWLGQLLGARYTTPACT